MHIDEGGLPSGGSLSAHVSQKLEEAKRQAVDARDRQLKSSVQQGTLLARYGESAAPLAELFNHFQVRKLLEEVQTWYFRGFRPPVELTPMGVVGYGFKLDISFASEKILVVDTYYDIVPLLLDGFPSSLGGPDLMQYPRGRSNKYKRTYKHEVNADSINLLVSEQSNQQT